MLPHSDDVPYLLREIKLQAQQGQGLAQAAAFFNTTPPELDAWCLLHTPPKQAYTPYARHIRTKYASDLLLKQQKAAQEGSAVATRTLLHHLARTERHHAPEVAPENETPVRAAVYIGGHLLEAGRVLVCRAEHAYSFRGRRMEYALVLNPGMSEATPYANLRILFPTREARDAAQLALDQARLACPRGLLAVLPEPPR